MTYQDRVTTAPVTAAGQTFTFELQLYPAHHERNGEVLYIKADVQDLKGRNCEVFACTGGLDYHIVKEDGTKSNLFNMDAKRAATFAPEILEAITAKYFSYKACREATLKWAAKRQAAIARRRPASADRELAILLPWAARAAEEPAAVVEEVEAAPGAAEEVEEAPTATNNFVADPAEFENEPDTGATEGQAAEIERATYAAARYEVRQYTYGKIPAEYGVWDTDKAEWTRVRIQTDRLAAREAADTMNRIYADGRYPAVFIGAAHNGMLSYVIASTHTEAAETIARQHYNTAHAVARLLSAGGPELVIPVWVRELGKTIGDPYSYGAQIRAGGDTLQPEIKMIPKLTHVKR